MMVQINTPGFIQPDSFEYEPVYRIIGGDLFTYIGH